ncbi:MAG: aminopeptidase [Planctomycetota bacterium]
MRDPRLDKLANVLVHYSTKVQPGQVVRISGSVAALPLLEAVYETCLKAGAHPFVRCSPDSLADLFFEHANDDQLDYLSPLAVHEIENIDVSIGAWADLNTKAMSQIDPTRQGKVSAARRPISETFMKRAAAAEDPESHHGVKPLTWCGTQYPTQASAQDAECSLYQYEKFVFEAGFLDHDDPVAVWKEIHTRQQRVVDYLNTKSVIHFSTPAGTDLTVNTDGMKWINCAGQCNFPDGEVFTGPNLDHPDGGVNGVVHYSFPAVHHGREVHDIVLTFEKGRVVDAQASKGLDFLNAMLDQDEGARALGEIAIGTNYSITDYTKNTLFDEKIGGTFHAAVGAGYPETGNANQSGLHWDMVCDLREGGTIKADGELISQDGRFVFPDWPAPVSS